MEESKNQDKVFLELRQRLESGLLVLRSDVAESSADVEVCAGDRSLLIRAPTLALTVSLPPGVTLVPGSCRQATGAAGEGLHLRLRLQVEQHTEACGSVLGRLQAQKSYCFGCQRCGEQLTRRVFRRVLPLPNGNWNALVDDWCCHPDPFANRKLLPRQEDCLLGDTYFLLPRDSECDRTLSQGPGPAPTDQSIPGSGQRVSRVETVLCNSCGAVLGEAVSTDTLKLYITEVTVRLSNEEAGNYITQCRRPFVERAVAARLVELSTTQSMFRFSIQTPIGTTAILLWLLNTDSLLASLSEMAAGSDASLYPGDRLHGEHLSCPASSAIKVLYLPCSPSMQQNVTETWEKDVGVHSLTLPQSTCQEVIQLLTACTSCLPPSLRTMNAFQVAFLKL